MKNKLWVIIVILCFVLLAIGLFLFVNRFKFKFSDNMEVNVNEQIDKKLVTACYGNIFKCNKADISFSKLNVKKIGKYKVNVTATYKKHKKTIVKEIKVVDKVAPKITVEGDTLTVCPNQKEIDIKYSASDNYDGDITKKVVKKVNKDNIELSVSDSSKNSDVKKVSLKKEDTTQPEITLNGQAEMSILLNSGFTDPGYSAKDNCDDVSDKVKVEGSVDTSNVGTYTLTYSVNDESGNSTSVTRKVNVYKKRENYGTGVIYLTFDDGPSAYTSELLDVLSKYNVKATFFVTGRAPGYNYNITRAYNEGHAIGLHTNTHNYNYVYLSIDAYFEDLNTISNTVKNLTGVESKLVRFPGGSSNTVSRITPGIMTSLSGMLLNKGYQYFDWNVSSGDASGSVKSSDVYASNVINSLGSGSYYIVLQHDTNASSVRAVSRIIEYGQSHGYTFDKLSLGSPTVHHRIAN